MTVAVSVVVASATATDPADRAVEVALQDDGSAAVSVTDTYDLAETSERQALLALREEDTARDALSARFADRLRQVADATADRTGRQMSIESPRVEIVTDDAVGAVTVTVTWNGLAAVEGDELTLAEPFASEFRPDRPLRVIAPDGYAIEDASPSPDGNDGDRVSWSACSDLAGFAVTASPDGPSGALGPGSGVAGAVAGIIAATAVARRTR